MVSGIRLLLNAIDKQYEIVLSSFFIRRQFEVYLAFIREKKKMNWRLFEDTNQTAFCCLFKDKSKSNLAFLFLFEERKKREDNILYILKTLCKLHFILSSKTNQSLIYLFFFFLKREKRSTIRYILKHSINYKLSDSSKIIQSLFVFSFYP
jgi:hypothetical protein